MTGERLLALAHAGLRELSRITGYPRYAGLALRGGDIRAYLGLRQEWLRRMKFRTVLDIGANHGQFALAARRAFPEATVHCFEPIPDCFATLSRRLGRVPEVVLHNVALADTAGLSSMVRNEFSPSSSLLEMDMTHVREFPWTAKGSQVAVSVSTLDAALARVQVPTPVLVKIDVQGAEDRVIAGGRATLARAAVVIIETSFERLYKGQPLFDDIYRLLCAEGFVYQGSLGQLVSPQDGRVLQNDSIFVRR